MSAARPICSLIMHFKSMVYCEQTTDGGDEEKCKTSAESECLFNVDSRYACVDTVKTSDDNQAKDKCDY
jgi:hypothetical protein